MFKVKKNADAAVNTTVSFKPEDEVEIIVQTQAVTGKIQQEQTKFDEEISDDELAGPSYIDYEKSQQEPKISLLKIILKEVNIWYFDPVYYPYFVNV